LGYPVERVPRAPTSVDIPVLGFTPKALGGIRRGCITMVLAAQEFRKYSEFRWLQILEPLHFGAIYPIGSWRS
jgi:hypothetical protein